MARVVEVAVLVALPVALPVAVPVAVPALPVALPAAVLAAVWRGAQVLREREVGEERARHAAELLAVEALLAVDELAQVAAGMALPALLEEEGGEEELMEEEELKEWPVDVRMVHQSHAAGVMREEQALPEATGPSSTAVPGMLLGLLQGLLLAEILRVDERKVTEIWHVVAVEAVAELEPGEGA